LTSPPALAKQVIDMTGALLQPQYRNEKRAPYDSGVTAKNMKQLKHLHPSIPGFLGGKVTSLCFDVLRPCSMGFTGRPSLSTVAILLCSISLVLETALPYLIASASLLTPTLFSPSPFTSALLDGAPHPFP
jgi:hypothetical protein